MQTANYLTNKELLAELNCAKATYCYFIEPAYADFDAIAENIEEVTPAFLEDARAAKEKRTKAPATIEGLIVRVMTAEHIPPQYVHEGRAPRGGPKLPFKPFKHYRVTSGRLVEVGRSHWSDALENGRFVPDKGRVTPRLGKMWMLLTERYISRSNWRGYSYKDDMRSAALVQLMNAGLSFNEARTQNPFAYWSTMVENVYKRGVKQEQRVADLRDDLLIMEGATPSLKRQLADEDAAKAGAPLKKKLGRPRKVRSSVSPQPALPA